MDWQILLVDLHHTQHPQPGGMLLRLGGDGRVLWSFLGCWEQRLVQVLARKQGTLHG